MEILGKYILYLIVAILRFTDNIFDIFRVMAGIQEIDWNGSKVTIFNMFLKDRRIVTVFWSIFIVGAMAGAVCAIIGMFRSTQSARAKSPQKVVGKWFVSIMATIAVFFFVGMIVGATSSILQVLEKAIRGTGKESIHIGNSIINALIKTATSGIKTTVTWKEIDIHAEGATVNSIVIDIIGRIKKNTWGIPEIGKFETYPLGSDVFTPVRTTFPYFLGLLVSLILLGAVTISTMKLVIRLFDVLLLQTALPLPMATYCLDDGQRMKAWRTQMIQCVVLAYGMVFSVNIFVIFVPIIGEFQISQGTDVGARILNSTTQLLLLAGGSFTIFKGQKILQEILGIEEGQTSITGGSIKSTIDKVKDKVGGVFKGKIGSGKGEGNKGGGGKGKGGKIGGGSGGGADRAKKQTERKQRQQKMQKQREQRRESNKNGGRARIRATERQQKLKDKIQHRENKSQDIAMKQYRKQILKDDRAKQRIEDKKIKEQKKIDDRNMRANNKAETIRINNETRKIMKDWKERR